MTYIVQTRRRLVLSNSVSQSWRNPEIKRLYRLNTDVPDSSVTQHNGDDTVYLSYDYCRHTGHEGLTKRFSGHQVEQPSIKEGAGGEEHPAATVGPGETGVPTTNSHQTHQVSWRIIGHMLTIVLALSHQGDHMHITALVGSVICRD